ncbi:MAG: 50S ribosomal protein L21 [Candidatus Dormibacteraeota bacterium]|nr:50S ribosomal protein L21 [Candidatus Dormibacteraeota bacterium]
MPKPDSSLSAVVVSGGKQYRVAPGDHILVDRLAAEPGSSLKLDRVLLFTNGGDIKVGAPAVDGIDVEVKVLAHRRGPRIETIRYKSKKRVRVHRGGRADLTALEIIAVGGIKAEVKADTKAEAKTETKARAAGKTARKPRAKAEAKKEPVTAKAQVEEPEKAPEKKLAKRANSKKDTK